MGDTFREQLVKKRPTSIDAVKKAGLIFAGVLLAFILMLLFGKITILLDIAIFFGVYYIFIFLNVEYEYIYTNGELDIDVIYSKSKRKRVFSQEIKELDVMAHVNDKEHEREFTGAKTKDYSSGVIGENTYAFATVYKGEKVKIVFEPNQTMIESMKITLSSRKFFPKK